MDLSLCPSPILSCEGFAGTILPTEVPEVLTSDIACRGVAKPLQPERSRPVGCAVGLRRTGTAQGAMLGMGAV